MTNEEVLEEQRAKCRAFEVSAPSADGITDLKIKASMISTFKYTARTFWWDYLTKSQRLVRYVMPFREFWNNEDTYPRTIETTPEVK
jgi:hypothetical protein